MKLHEVLDENYLRELMLRLLRRAGYFPFLKDWAGDVIIRVPLNDESYVRLQLQGDYWRAVLVLKRMPVEIAPKLDSSEVIPWIEALGYPK